MTERWWLRSVTFKSLMIHHCHYANSETTQQFNRLPTSTNPPNLVNKNSLTYWPLVNLLCLKHQMNSFQTQAAVYRWGNDPGDHSPPPAIKSSTTTHQLTPHSLCTARINERCSYQCCSWCPSSDHTAWLQFSQHSHPQEVTLLICSSAQRTQEPREEEAGDPRDLTSLSRSDKTERASSFSSFLLSPVQHWFDPCPCV